MLLTREVDQEVANLWLMCRVKCEVRTARRLIYSIPESLLKWLHAVISLRAQCEYIIKESPTEPEV